MRTCTVDGCDRKHEARGYCHTHYSRFIRIGSALDEDTRHGGYLLGLSERLALVGFTETPSGCLEWNGAIDRAGYGRTAHGGKRMTVHRAVASLRPGGIPEGMHVLHRCDNRKCGNDAHLFFGTNADNAKDRSQKGRSAHQRRTACKNGHPFTEENMRVRFRGNSIERLCLVCGRERKRAERIRKRA